MLLFLRGPKQCKIIAITAGRGLLTIRSGHHMSVLSTGTQTIQFGKGRQKLALCKWNSNFSTYYWDAFGILSRHPSLHPTARPVPLASPASVAAAAPFAAWRSATGQLLSDPFQTLRILRFEQLFLRFFFLMFGAPCRWRSTVPQV